MLVGFRSREPISRAERFLAKPNLQFALACEVIFDTPVRELFPGVFDELAEDVLNECEILHERISSKTGSEATEKRRLLRKLLGRPEPNPDTV